MNAAMALSLNSDSYCRTLTLDRLTHHVSILEMNGESYRLNQSRARLAKANK